MHNLFFYDGIVYHEEGPGLLHSTYQTKEAALIMQELLVDNGTCVGYKEEL